MFKVGDKVRYIGPTDYFGIKYGDIVLLTGHDGVHFYTSGRNSSEIRIKPEPKPDSIKFGALVDASDFMTVVWHVSKQSSDNVKATFDGETGVLKAIELLK